MKTDLPESTLTKKPTIHSTAFLATGTVVIGDVQVGEDSSIWYNAVLRGDINRIQIGARTNIQDGSVIHLENDRDCVIGDDVTVGHRAILHGCRIESGALVGMGAIVLNGAVVGKGAVVAAGAVVKENMQVPESTLVAGVPAKIVKALPQDTIEINKRWAKKYVELAKLHRKVIDPASSAPL